ncbi:MAG: DNA repair protein RecN [Candidatus Poribacteria bacterium]
MLDSLLIKNFALIDSTEIILKPGLNIISGETGAGKSIIIEAIAVILGGRISPELIRSGSDEAVIQGLFDISKFAWVEKRLTDLGFNSESQELIIKRTISRSGKNRAYINGELAQVSHLQKLCDGLVDLCSQHEHQSLLKPAIQLELVDRFGGLTVQAAEMGALFYSYKSLHEKNLKLVADRAELAKKKDFLEFQVNELRAANLIPNEDETIMTEKQLLQSAETRAQAANAIIQLLQDEENGLLNSIQAILARAKALSQLDGSCDNIRGIFETLSAEAEESIALLNRYYHQIEANPDRLQSVQERLAQITDLKRKYGRTVQDMLEHLNGLEAELSSMVDHETMLSTNSTNLAESKENFLRSARTLTPLRQISAKKFSNAVTAELRQLQMTEATFEAKIINKLDIENWNEFGAEQIMFTIQTNLGEPSLPIGRIASGGELSRIMLAIRSVIADHGGIGVYLFDEIDAGIGGQTAFQVGKKLKSVAKYNQVICITHLPQVASFANHHIAVKKSEKNKRTITEIMALNQSQRRTEIARMLGGSHPTKKTLDTASELLELAQ